MIKLEIYDLDHTLVLSNPLHFKGYNNGFLDVYGKRLSEEIMINHFGKALRPLITGICRDLQIEPSDSEIENIISIWEETVIEGAIAGNLQLLDGVPDCLNPDYPNTYRGIATGSKGNVAKAFLEHTNLLGYFEFFSYGCNANNKVEIVRNAMDIAEKKLGNIDLVIMFGDTPGDMIGGKDIGAYCVGLLTGKNSEKELKEAGADTVLESLAHYNTIHEKLS